MEYTHYCKDKHGNLLLFSDESAYNKHIDLFDSIGSIEIEHGRLETSIHSGFINDCIKSKT